jgi:RNA polymerase sigma-70 factor (ECF subfamily)
MKSPTALLRSPRLGGADERQLTTVPKTRRLSDATLVRRSQQGDRRAFGALLGRYDWRLRGLAHALLLDRDEMDAALRIAYLRAWRDVVRINAKDDVGAWLYRVTYNACIDQLRRVESPSDVPATGIAAGLATLSAADRVAVVLVDREGFTVASAARILGLTPEVLAPRLAAARQHLADHLPPPQAEAPDAEPEPEADLAASSEPEVAMASESEPDEAGSEPDDAAAPGSDVAVSEPEVGSEPESEVAASGPEAAPDAAPEHAPDPVAEPATYANGDDPVDEPTPDEPTADEPTADEPTADAGANGNGRTDAETAATTTSGAASTGGTGNGGGNGHAPNRGRGRRARRRAQHTAGRPSPDATGPTGPDGPDGSTDAGGDVAP